MRKIFVLVVLLSILSLSYSQYIETICSGCGDPEPAICSKLQIYRLNCSIPSAAFSCQRQLSYEGWLFCPSCPQDYSLARCESSWLFGLYKTSYCVQDYSVGCGEYCDRNDNVLSRAECEIPKKITCCNRTTNYLELIKPPNDALFFRNETINFTFAHYGSVEKIALIYGDGKTEWKTPGENGTTSFLHSYRAVGSFEVLAEAHTCVNCTHNYVSRTGVNISIRYEN